MTQGKKHMGGRRRFVKLTPQVPASRVGIKEKTPTKPKPTTGKGEWSTIGTQPTRAMLGLKIVKGGK